MYRDSADQLCIDAVAQYSDTAIYRQGDMPKIRLTLIMQGNVAGNAILPQTLDRAAQDQGMKPRAFGFRSYEGDRRT